MIRWGACLWVFFLAFPAWAISEQDETIKAPCSDVKNTCNKDCLISCSSVNTKCINPEGKELLIPSRQCICTLLKSKEEQTLNELGRKKNMGSCQLSLGSSPNQFFPFVLLASVTMGVILLLRLYRVKQNLGD